MRKLAPLFVAAFSLLLSIFIAPKNADAWVCAVPACTHWCGDNAQYFFADSSDDLGPVSSDISVRAGMDDWTLVSCSSIRVEHKGTASSRPGFADDTNVVGWVESSWKHGAQVIGLTTLWWVADDCLSEGDIELNGQDFEWTEGPGLGLTVNAYTVILHEAGHFYGLGHTGDGAAVMFPSYDGGIKLLHPDDEAGICDIYSGTPSYDCTVVGCPRGQFCLDSTCVAPSGPGLTCQACDTNADCGEAEDMCLQYGAGSFCGRSCTSDADCGGGATQCVEVDGGARQCIRLDATDTPSCEGCRVNAECDTGYCASLRGVCDDPPARDKEVGTPCESNLECISGLCTLAGGGLICTQFCDRTQSESCPADFYCGGNVNLACNAGLCTPGTKGTKSPGADCVDDAECESGTCSSGACVLLCERDDDCGPRLSCQKLAGGCGVCRTNGNIGDPCRANEQCKVGFCFSDPNLTDSICSSDCANEVPCPVGGECRELGSAAVCLPPASGLKAIGEPCIALQECDSGVCVLGAGGQAFCSRSCGDTSECPAGYNCAGFYCSLAPRESIPMPFVGGGEGQGGCSAAASAGTQPRGRSAFGSLALLAGLLTALRTVRRP